ncbi:MAG TPA: Bcr/CflA family multidrug efflux MFS transporter [Magnetospirillaceae bacterium]|jgi:DHA1 family bicyclomycin/chloramphenicol resistance-like MFS transporter
MAAKTGRIELILILGSLAAFGPLATDMYLPALPEVARALGGTSSQVQITVATFFFGFAAGQLIYGPLSDRFGRKPPLYWGLGLFTLTSGLCALAPSVDTMIALRFIEAFGACAGTVISRAIVRDLFKPEEGARVFSTLMLVMVIAPIVAPLIGGYLLLWFDWQSIFWAITLAGALSLASVVFRLPESRKSDPEHSLALGNIVKVYASLLMQRRYLMVALSGAFGYGGLFAYITGSPFVFIEGYKLAPQHYGWLFAINSAGIMAASQINRALIHRLGAATMLRAAGAFQMLVGVAMFIVAVTQWGGMIAFVVPLFLYVACNGIVMPNSTALGLADQQKNAGAAAALMGSIQFSVGTISALSIGALHAVTPLPVAAVIALAGTLTTLALLAAR